ncbi:hypothetical protein EDD16DRAFT_1648373 [Pisolithus croceorrhizus]|nr:hypothetical protein EDD16DRAFT_1648373 [Pisolithus croceorrhizus]
MSSVGTLRTPIPMSAIRPDDVITCIAMGKTGSGMSNAKDGTDQLSSRTQTVCAYKCYCNGHRFVFVDTSSLNNGQLSQCAVFTAIATWLTETYASDASDIHPYPRNGSMGAVDEQSFQLLYRLCGNEAADRVQLVTTMWDEVDESEAVEVEETLKGTHWQSFMQAGAQPRRFDNTSESAWNITLLLQKELVDMGKTL